MVACANPQPRVLFQVYELAIPVNNEVTTCISVFVSFFDLFILIGMSSDIPVKYTLIYKTN